MQLSTALLLCIIILGLTGGLAPLQALFRIRPFHAVYFAVCMLALSAFVFAPVAQLRLSLQTVMAPLSLSLWAWHERPNPGAPAALLFFSLAAFFAGRTETPGRYPKRPAHRLHRRGCRHDAGGHSAYRPGGGLPGAGGMRLGGGLRQPGDRQLRGAGPCQRRPGGRPDERPLLWRYPLMPISGCPGTKTVCGMTFLSLGDCLI